MANAQPGKPFPTDAEIKFALTQTERAIKLYKPLIDVEELQIGKSKDATEAIAHDREVVEALEMAVNGLKEKPQAFNGPLGFMFVQWLRDADRNALLCAIGALSQTTLLLMAGNTETAASGTSLVQNCTDASALIFTVTESIGSLFQKYVEAEEELAKRCTETLDKCADILKKNPAQFKK